MAPGSVVFIVRGDKLNCRELAASFAAIAFPHKVPHREEKRSLNFNATIRSKLLLDMRKCVKLYGGKVL